MRDKNTIWMELPADLKYLNVLDSSISAILTRVEHLPEIEKVAYDLNLALQEACSNIVRHAYHNLSEGRIGVTFTIESAPDRLIIELSDTGKSFALTDMPKPDLNNPQVHGYGLFLMEQLLDQVEYFPQPNGNRWRLVKYL